MAVKIRLMRIGKKKDPKYRIIVIESSKKQTSKYIDKIGYYDPQLEKDNFQIDENKLIDWQSKGAQLSGALIKLLPTKFIK
jgi:small subunit ribosomal protein S16